MRRLLTSAPGPFRPPPGPWLTNHAYARSQSAKDGRDGGAGAALAAAVDGRGDQLVVDAASEPVSWSPSAERTKQSTSA